MMYAERESHASFVIARSSLVAIAHCAQLWLFASPSILQVSPAIERLDQLRTLNLAHNKLIRLPREICNLPSLQAFRLEHNGACVAALLASEASAGVHSHWPRGCA